MLVGPPVCRVPCRRESRERQPRKTELLVSEHSAASRARGEALRLVERMGSGMEERRCEGTGGGCNKAAGPCRRDWILARAATGVSRGGTEALTASAVG